MAGKEEIYLYKGSRGFLCRTFSDTKAYIQCKGVTMCLGCPPNADTSALERQIDEMVYKLYALTDEEIKIVEGKK